MTKARELETACAATLMQVSGARGGGARDGGAVYPATHAVKMEHGNVSR